MLTTLFQYDAFTTSDVGNASLSLMAYAVGLPAFILVKVLVPGFTARQDMKTPVKIGMIAVASNMLMSVTLVLFFQHAGLALATSMAAFVNAGLLFAALLKEGAFKPQPGWLMFLLKVLLANLSVAVIYVYDYSALQWYEWGVFDRALHLTLEILAVILLYVTTAFLVGIRPRHLAFKS